MSVKSYTLLDVGVGGGDSFSIVNSIATLEKNCLSTTVVFRDDNLNKQPDGFFEMTIGKNRFVLNKVTTAGNGGGSIISTHATRVVDVMAGVHGMSLDNYIKFLSGILCGAGVYILSGTKTSSLKSFARDISNNLISKGLNIVRISRLGSKFCYSVGGKNMIIDDITTIKELIVLYKYDIVMVDATASSSLIKMAVYLGELGFTCVVEMSSRSGCHVIETMNRVFGAKRFSSVVRSILFIGAVPRVNKSDFKRVQFKDDFRFGFWGGIPYAPRQCDTVLSCSDFDYAKGRCGGKIFLCELIDASLSVAEDIMGDWTARDYITTFSLSPTWKSIYAIGAREVKSMNTTVDFLDFFIGRY